MMAQHGMGLYTRGVCGFGFPAQPPTFLFLSVLFYIFIIFDTVHMGVVIHTLVRMGNKERGEWEWWDSIVLA